MKTNPIKKAAPATQSELARRLGVTRQAIAVHASKPDAPPIHDVEKWEIYLSSVGRSGTLPADLRRQIGEKRLAILEETRQSLERENKKASRELVPAEEVRRFIARMAQTYFLGVKQILAEAPRELQGATKEQIKLWGDAQYEALTRKLSQEQAYCDPAIV